MKTYTRLPVARYSPENHCHVPDGEVLYVEPRKVVSQRPHLAHFFVSAKDRKTKSQYGWVRDVEPFTTADFIGCHLSGPLLTEQVAVLETMFRSIERLAPNTPVAATYSLRGVETRTMELSIHRVLLYDVRAPQDTAQ
jgi:hypothetical protein